MMSPTGHLKVLAFLATAGALAASAPPAAGNAAATPPAAASAMTRTSWREVKQVAARGGDVFMTRPAVVSASDAWALGEIVYPADVIPLVLHWNGTYWRRMPLPRTVTNYFDDTDLWVTIGASAGGNVWAFTLNGHYLRLHDKHWTAGLLPHSSYVDIESVQVFSQDDVWAFGGRIANSGFNSPIYPFAARFNGSTWTTYRVPGAADISATSALSPHDIYAVSRYLASSSVPRVTPRILHWNGLAWRAMPIQPHLRLAVVLSAVLADSDANVWVGGSRPSSSKTTADLLLHWDGKSWASATPRFAAHVNGEVLSLAADGADGIWLLGLNYSALSNQLAHYSDGAWSSVRPKWLISDLAAVAHTTSTWATGTLKLHGRYVGVILVHGLLPR